MIRRLVLFLFIGICLAACGQGETPLEPTAAIVTETAATVAETETVAPAATDTAMVQAEATTPALAEAAAATATIAAAHTSAPAPATAAATATAQSGIPSGRTDAGIFYLGQPDAPVTVRDYSDFL
ncbi:MAG: hypothetical protein Fur0021_21160 [Candidatus Promineifilaceae bacterium]